jgi:hypothetical protein
MWSDGNRMKEKECEEDRDERKEGKCLFLLLVNIKCERGLAES